MTRQARCLAAAAFAACVSFSAFSAVGVANADTCLTKAGAPGPTGSRWYYRIEWPSQRKCWHLVQKDKRPTIAAKAAPQPEADDETEAAPLAPAASAPPARAALPEARPAQPQAVPAWITRNASNIDEASVLRDPPAAAAPPVQAPPPVTQTESNAPPVVAAPAAPQPVATRDTVKAANPDGALSPWRLLFAAIALFGFAAAAVLIVLEVRRRRTDVLNNAMAADVAPEDSEEPQPVEDAPTFAPLPPMGMHRGDDIEEVLRRFTESWRRRAA
jgi:hypothetical protein